MKYCKEKDEMDTLFNMFKHIRDISTYGREIIDKLIM